MVLDEIVLITNDSVVYLRYDKPLIIVVDKVGMSEIDLITYCIVDVIRFVARGWDIFLRKFMNLEVTRLVVK